MELVKVLQRTCCSICFRDRYCASDNGDGSDYVFGCMLDSSGLVCFVNPITRRRTKQRENVPTPVSHRLGSCHCRRRCSPAKGKLNLQYQ
jgi:hypothetical protein